MEKIKVVWICHFSTGELQQHLGRECSSPESALWVKESLDIAEKDPRFELHVICAHGGVEKSTKFNLRGVNYYCFDPHVASKPDMMTGYMRNRRTVKKLVRSIKPDVIHLFGAENPYYSSTILPLFKDYPVILSVQGFAYKIEDSSFLSKFRQKIESSILKKMPVAFYRTEHMKVDLRSFNSNIHLTWGTFNSEHVNIRNTVSNPEYDLVFFARVCRDKGIYDLLQAMAIVKKKKEDVSLCVIGGGPEVMKASEYARKLGLERIRWAGYQNTLDDVHRIAVNAKVSVLPTHSDMIPGTIIESMLLGIPVVSYAVDSIPEINAEGEVIKLVRKGDINDLAAAIYELLSNKALREQYAASARKRASQMFVFDDATLNQALWDGYTLAMSIFNQK